MYNEIQKNIDELFLKINADVNKIINNSVTVDAATQQIMETVSGEITASVQGYMIDIYSELSKETLAESIFQNAKNANKFYELNLRHEISQAYQFDIQDLRAYTNGIGYEEVGKIYAVAASVGSATIGGVLLGILSGVVHMSRGVVIAGAVACGAIGGITAGKKVDGINMRKYKNAIMTFMDKLKKDLIEWVDDIIAFYNKKVNELKASL